MLWKWKLARDVDDVLHLLNGETRYDHPVPDARVCMTWRGGHPQFWVFALKAARSREPHDGVGKWSCRRATEEADVVRMLRGEGPGGPMAQAQVAATWDGKEHLFFVFHRGAAPGREGTEEPADWALRRATDADDALGFLNGEGPGGTPVATARIATTHRDRHDEFFIFYRPGHEGGAVQDWRWQEAGSADGIRWAVERQGRPCVDFQLAAPPTGIGTFHVFTDAGMRAGGRLPQVELMANG
jgi:hypothetical protein